MGQRTRPSRPGCKSLRPAGRVAGPMGVASVIRIRHPKNRRLRPRTATQETRSPILMNADEFQRWASILRWVGLSVTAIGVLITFGSHYIADKLPMVQRAEKATAEERLKAS